MLNRSVVESVESRLQKGESLRTIARSMNVTYQALQYHRRMAGSQPLRKAHSKGSTHASWRGGSFIDRYGYKMVLAPERGKCSPYAMEHVLIAEKKIGRLLNPNEHVHHIDGDKTNNAENNLLVCTAKRHRELHRSLEVLAYDFIRRGLIRFNGTSYEIV